MASWGAKTCAHCTQERDFEVESEDASRESLIPNQNLRILQDSVPKIYEAPLLVRNSHMMTADVLPHEAYECYGVGRLGFETLLGKPGEGSLAVS